MSTDHGDQSSDSTAVPAITGPQAVTTQHKPLVYLLVIGSLLCIPYIPIRRHLLGLRQSVNALSANTAILQRELSNALHSAQIRKEEYLRLSDQLAELQTRLDSATGRAAQAETARINSERNAIEKLHAISDRVAQAETARLKAEEALRRQIGGVRKRFDKDRIPPEVLHELCSSIGDTAAFIEEVEIQLGWSQSIPRDRGIDRMRQLALKFHAMAQKPQSHDIS